MSDDFNDTFKEVGALWNTKSGKGLSGKLKEDLPAGQRILIFPNKSDNSSHPTHKIFIPRDSGQLPTSATGDQVGTPVGEDPDMPF